MQYSYHLLHQFQLLEKKLIIKKIALLYGKRWVYDDSSLSISGGLSINTYSNRITDENNERIKIKDDYIGFPLEVNFKLFQIREKKDIEYME